MSSPILVLRFRGAASAGPEVFPEPFPGQPRVAPITVFSSAVPAAAFKQVLRCAEASARLLLFYCSVVFVPFDCFFST